MTVAQLRRACFKDEQGMLCRWLKVGEFIGDDDFYLDTADGKFRPTTNAGRRVNHRLMYRHRLVHQRPAGCLTWKVCLTS